MDLFSRGPSFSKQLYDLMNMILAHCGAIKHALGENFSLKPSIRLFTVERRVKANFSLSCAARGMVKKQSLRSITMTCQSCGIMAGKVTPGCRAPISCMMALMSGRLCNDLHFPYLFGMTKMGVFQRSVWSAFSCSWTRWWAVKVFPLLGATAQPRPEKKSSRSESGEAYK